jgi:predicted nucleic acid-binding protein
MILGGNQFPADPAAVLALAESTHLTAYDLEYVELAHRLNVPLVTFDKQVLRKMPGVAVHPRDFVSA